MSRFRPKGHGTLVTLTKSRPEFVAVGEAFTCLNANRHKELIEKLLDLIAVDCAIDQGEISGEVYGDTVMQTVKDITEQVDKVHQALKPHMYRIAAEKLHNADLNKEAKKHAP